MLHVLEHALIESLYVLPVLAVVYILLELLEFRGISRFEKSHLLKGNASPVFGALLGCVPQCGFSVVSTDLFAKKKLSIGALIAVFIATSDEAIPLMLADIDAIPYLLLLIAFKIVFGIAVGYLAIFLHAKLFRNNTVALVQDNQGGNSSKQDRNNDLTETKFEHYEEGQKENQIETLLTDVEHNENGEHDEEHHASYGCCHHDIAKEKFDWKHPLLHSLKIFAFILIVNVVFGTIIHFVGEDTLVKFLNLSSVFQPLIAVIVGLIPNCASSVVITELYLLGGLSFGALFTGLSVNAGLGIVVLFKENKNFKENLFIMTVLILSSILIGYGLHFLF